MGPDYPQDGMGLLAKSMDRPSPNFLQRITQALFKQQPIEGLLGEGDISAARQQGLLAAGAALSDAGGWQAGPPVGIMQAVGRGLSAGQQAFRGATDQAMQRAGAATQHAGQTLDLQAKKDALAQQTRLRIEREAYIRRNPFPQNGTIEEKNEWYRNAMAFAQQIGDTDMMRSLSGYLATQQPKSFKEVDRGDVIEIVDPVTGEVIRTAKVGPRPMDPNTRVMRDIARQDRLDRDRFNREQKIYSRFEKDFGAEGRYTKAALILKDTLADKNRALAGDRAAQLRILYGFINSMDDSVVREGEMALVRAMAPLKDQAILLKDKLREDEGYAISPTLIKQMIGVLERRNSRTGSLAKQRADFYKKWAERENVNLETFVPPDVFEGFEQSGQGAAGITGSILTAADLGLGLETPPPRSPFSDSDATRARTPIARQRKDMLIAPPVIPQSVQDLLRGR